ncbi:hypothetical protein YBT020_05505 [Bacillus thuringiensis serovar finitimus YBT-020]|nr:hypothetical protein YBT020_05505 [Bacillus thuringiensis serovar finitimus YBT-020]
MIYEVIDYCAKCEEEIEKCDCVCNKCDEWLHDYTCDETK